MTMSYTEKERSPGPKKLLALDGGGIRGVITLEVLAAMESMLRSGTRPRRILRARRLLRLYRRDEHRRGDRCRAGPRHAGERAQGTVPLDGLEDVQEGSVAAARVEQVPSRSAHRRTARRLRQGDHLRRSEPAHPAPDGAAERQHRFPLAAREQHWRQIQRPWPP